MSLNMTPEPKSRAQFKKKITKLHHINKQATSFILNIHRPHSTSSTSQEHGWDAYTLCACSKKIFTDKLNALSIFPSTSYHTELEGCVALCLVCPVAATRRCPHITYVVSLCATPDGWISARWPCPAELACWPLEPRDGFSHLPYYQLVLDAGVDVWKFRLEIFFFSFGKHRPLPATRDVPPMSRRSQVWLCLASRIETLAV
jgi:hypothetical protein